MWLIILKNLRSILIFLALAGASLMLWQYVRVNVSAATSTIKAQAATEALAVSNKAASAANTSTASRAGTEIVLRERSAVANKKAQKAIEDNYEWSKQAVPAAALDAINSM